MAAAEAASVPVLRHALSGAERGRFSVLRARAAARSGLAGHGAVRSLRELDCVYWIARHVAELVSLLTQEVETDRLRYQKSSGSIMSCLSAPMKMAHQSLKWSSARLFASRHITSM